MYKIIEMAKGNAKFRSMVDDDFFEVVGPAMPNLLLETTLEGFLFLIPEEAREYIREHFTYLVDNSSTWQEFVQHLGKQGLLKAPVEYISNECGDCVKLRWNKFLAWHGDYYQVSGNAYRDYTRGASPNHLWECLSRTSGNDALLFHIAYMCLAGCQFREFNELYDNDSPILSKLLCTERSVKSFIEDGVPSYNSPILKFAVMQDPDMAGSVAVLAKVHISHEYITVFTDVTTRTLKLPANCNAWMCYILTLYMLYDSHIRRTVGGKFRLIREYNAYPVAAYEVSGYVLLSSTHEINDGIEVMYNG